MKMHRKMILILSLIVFSCLLSFSSKETISHIEPEVLTLQENFGDQRDFWTRNFVIQEYEQVHATLLAVGNWCYLYMDNRTIDQLGQSQAIQKCEIYADEFDDNIYPKNVEFMGDPDGIFGDIDGDPRITILIYPAVRGGGYYLEGNEMDHTHSNYREMIYINSVLNTVQAITTICHEFNHLILFNSDLNEADFLIEGIAEYSIYHAGYFSDDSYIPPGLRLNLSYHANYYEDHPETSLFYFDPVEYAYLTYGASYMFIFYLVEQYGIQVITNLLAIDSDGPKGVEKVLLHHGYNISFNELFLNWITACTIDQLGIHNNLYGFVNLDFHSAISTEIENLPYSRNNVQHNCYGFDVKKINSPPNEFTLKIETPKSPRSLGISAIIHDDNGWNITKSIVTGNGDFTYLYLTGENIETAYILTSMIKKDVEDAPRDFITAPFENLDYRIYEGYNIPEQSSFSFSITAVLIVFLSSLTLIVRKRRSKKNRNFEKRSE